MARGPFRLDLKRDDPRTLMMKIDRRSTFGGRERHHAFRLEAEKEIRHINFAQQLSEASFNRSHREMTKRMEFFKGLVQANQERREKLEADLIQRGELAPNHGRKKKRRQFPELPKKRPKPDLHNASVVGSVRRDQTEYVGSKRQSNHLLRSLNEMNASEKKHMDRHKEMLKIEEAKNEVRHGNLASNEIQKADNTNHLIIDSSNADKVSVQARTLSLPKLTDQERRKAPVPIKPTLQRRTSLSNMIASGEISDLQEQSRDATFGGDKPGLARSFYLNTSRPQFKVKPTLPKFKLPPLPEPKLSEPLSKDSDESLKVNKSRFTVDLPPQLLPEQFVKDQVVHNPFIDPELKPEILRSRDLIEHTGKNDEMYVWLGFDSAEEFHELLAEAKKQRPKKKKKPRRDATDRGSRIDSAPNKDGSISKEGGDDQGDDGSESEDSLLAERLHEILAIDKEASNENQSTMEKTVASMSRRNSKFALIAPISALGEGVDRKVALKKFVSAARKVLAVNTWKENIGHDNSKTAEVDATQS